jgi:hypothetical protein
VLGLAQANTMVEMLKTDAGIEAQTVSSFVNQHLKAALAGKVRPLPHRRSAQRYHSGARRSISRRQQADE